MKKRSYERKRGLDVPDNEMFYTKFRHWYINITASTVGWSRADPSLAIKMDEKTSMDIDMSDVRTHVHQTQIQSNNTLMN